MNERERDRTFVYIIYNVRASNCVEALLRYGEYDLLQRAVTRDCVKKKEGPNASVQK